MAATTDTFSIDAFERTLTAPRTKQCSKCKAEKLLCEFARDKNKTSGLQSSCRVCQKTKIRQIDVEKLPRACSKCKEVKPAADFFFRNRKIGTILAQCKVCVTAKQSETWYARRKHDPKHRAMKRRLYEAYGPGYDAKVRAIKMEYKQTHPCVDCGEADAIVLEFDHTGKEKKTRNVSEIHCAIREVILAEISKCEVRCGNCHLKKTAARGNFFKHEFIATGTVVPGRNLTAHKNRLYIIAYLLAHPCEECKESDIRCLEFDHLDPATKYKNIADMINANGHARLIAEIAKCRVLCRCCHKRHTDVQQDQNKEFRPETDNVIVNDEATL